MKNHTCDLPALKRAVDEVNDKETVSAGKFNTDKKAKPTLKKDGSVDFFSLNILNHCGKGDVLSGYEDMYWRCINGSFSGVIK